MNFPAFKNLLKQITWRCRLLKLSRWMRWMMRWLKRETHSVVHALLAVLHFRKLLHSISNKMKRLKPALANPIWRATAAESPYVRRAANISFGSKQWKFFRKHNANRNGSFCIKLDFLFAVAYFTRRALQMPRHIRLAMSKWRFEDLSSVANAEWWRFPCDFKMSNWHCMKLICLKMITFDIAPVFALQFDDEPKTHWDWSCEIVAEENYGRKKVADI